jgi:hypothetical protein
MKKVLKITMIEAQNAYLEVPSTDNLSNAIIATRNYENYVKAKNFMAREAKKRGAIK